MSGKDSNDATTDTGPGAKRPVTHELPEGTNNRLITNLSPPVPVRVDNTPSGPVPVQSFSASNQELEIDDDELPSRRSPVRGLLPWTLVVLCILGGGFVAIRYYLPLVEKLQNNEAALAQSQKDNVVMRQQVDALESAQQELATKVAEREKEVAALQQTQDELVGKLDEEIKKGNVAISQASGQLVVDLVDKVVFDSGESEVNEKGMEVLRQVGETFLKVPDKIIQISGHTDAVPISPKLIERYPTNWELSTQRATNVVRFLQEQVNVPGERLAIVGRSQYQPVDSNASRSGRRRNRRIEVALLPTVKPTK